MTRQVWLIRYGIIRRHGSNLILGGLAFRSIPSQHGCQGRLMFSLLWLNYRRRPVVYSGVYLLGIISSPDLLYSVGSQSTLYAVIVTIYTPYSGIPGHL